MNAQQVLRGLLLQPKDPDHFAAYLTHELRAPVTAIKLGLEIFEEQVADRLQSDEKQTLRLAIRNTSRLQGLVNDIMDYTKILAGKMQLSFRSCDAREILSDVVSSFQPWAISRGIRLIKEDSGETLPWIKAEPGRIVQVLTNLISNAIKFTSAGGEVVVSAVEGVAEYAKTVVFTVRDTSCGIPAKDQKRIFQCFEQASSGTKTAGGTGLGLTLAKAMVEAHGGRIWVKSAEGCGSQFCFAIPSIPAELPDEINGPSELSKFHDFYKENCLNRVAAGTTLVLLLLEIFLGVGCSSLQSVGHEWGQSQREGASIQGNSDHDLRQLAILAAASRNVSVPLYLAIIQRESNFNPNVEDGAAGDTGLSQCIPSTHRFLLDSGRLNDLPNPGNLRDIWTNLNCGAAFLAVVMESLSAEDINRALMLGYSADQTYAMAYNAGPSRVRQWLLKGEIPDRGQRYSRAIKTILERQQIASFANAN